MHEAMSGLTCAPGDVTTLQDLARVSRKANHLSQQNHRQAHAGHQLALGNEMLTRLLWTMCDVFSKLSDYASKENQGVKREFMDLYNRLMREADTVLEFADCKERQIHTGFLRGLPLIAQTSLLTFLQRLREDPIWVAERFSRLTVQDFEILQSTADLDLKRGSVFRESCRGHDPLHNLQPRNALRLSLFGIFAAPGSFESEDSLRLEWSASILHRLIQDSKTTTKGDNFCLAVLDAWASVYDWEISKPFETLLMSILQKGTKMIERADLRQMQANSKENNTHPRNYYFSYAMKDEFEEEFFTGAIRDLFRLMVESNACGIPYGALLVARAMLDMADDGDKRHYEVFFMVNWFFGRFLAGMITSPEHHGLMNGYYISDIKRQRILQMLQQKILSCCVPAAKMSAQAYKRSLADDEIDSYMCSMSSVLRSDSSSLLYENTARSRSAGHGTHRSRSMTEYTQDATPYITLCASDIVTLYRAVCPKHRSAKPGSSFLSRQRSTSSAGSTRSVVFKSVNSSSKPMFDFGSSTLDESSDVDQLTVETDLLSSPGRHGIEILSGTSENGSDGEFMDRTRSAIDLLISESDTQGVGDVTSTSWEQLYLYPDHISLDGPQHMHMETLEESGDLVSTALQYLVENFDLGPRSVRRPRLPNNCYFTSKGSLQDHVLPTPHMAFGGPRELSTDSHLMMTLSMAAQKAFNQRQYQGSELLYKAHNLLQKMTNTIHAIDDFSPILYGLYIEQERKAELSQEHIEDRASLLAYAHDNRASILQSIDEMIHKMSKTRLRMWYIHDVKLSKIWSQSWEVIKCLKKMEASEGTAILQGHSHSLDSHAFPFQATNVLLRSNSRERRFPRFPRESRFSTSTAHLPSSMITYDSGILEVLAVPVSQGGPNKLTDEQCRQTMQWMRDSDIHNFCRGEERIHRLCYELDDLVRRLMKTHNNGVDALDIEEAVAASIWTQDLFSYESAIFDITRLRRGISPSESSAVVTEESSFSSLLRRGSASDLLNLTRNNGRARGNSLGSLDNPRDKHRSRASSATFAESLLSSRQSSPTKTKETSSQVLHRRMSALTVTESDQDEHEFDTQAIKDFLLQTEMGLVSLLISDFAETLYSSGSETDTWLNEDLTELAVSRADSHLLTPEPETNPTDKGVMDAPITVEQKQRLKLTKHHRTKSNVSHFFGGSGHVGESFKATPAPPSVDTNPSSGLSGLFMERTTSSSSFLDVRGSSDISITPITPNRSVYTRVQPFPLMRAYRETLLRLSVHPSPYEKLRALYDFELLVVSDLMATQESLKRPGTSKSTLQNPLVQPIKSSIASISPANLRQHEQSTAGDQISLTVKNLSIGPKKDNPQLGKALFSPTLPSEGPSTDAIVEEIMKIMKKSDLRPKTLFRDLQFIASFIPARILNMTDEGKVFWDFGLAALGVKRDALEAMIQWSTLIVEQKDSASEESCLTNALKMFTIAAKEGDVVAMRELGLLQADRPDIAPITVLPFSMAQETFQKGSRRPAAGEERTTDLMASIAAHAWLELAAAEGDSVAQKRLACTA